MAQIVMVTETGEEHGLINTLPNSVADDGFASMKPEMKSKAEKQKKEDSRIVKARYINHRGMHERLDKPYMRYAGDPIQIYHLIPGKTYDLPKGFVDEINEHKGLAQRADRVIDDKVMAKDQNPLKIHELVPISF
jgi:hypothetical protein